MDTICSVDMEKNVHCMPDHPYMHMYVVSFSSTSTSLYIDPPSRKGMVKSVCSHMTVGLRQVSMYMYYHCTYVQQYLENILISEVPNAGTSMFQIFLCVASQNGRQIYDRMQEQPVVCNTHTHTHTPILTVHTVTGYYQCLLGFESTSKRVTNIQCTMA